MKKWLSNISLAKKLQLIMGLASGVVIFGTLFFIVATSSLNKEFDAFDEKSFTGVKAVLETEKELNYFSRVTREIMLGGDLNENLNKLDETYNKIENLFLIVEKSTLDDEQRSL